MPLAAGDRADYAAKMAEVLVVDPMTSAILTVDMQRDYLDPLVASNPLATEDINSVMSRAGELLATARTCHIPIVHVYTVRRECEIAAGTDGSPRNRMGRRAGLSQNVTGTPRTIPDRIEGSPQSEVPSALVRQDDLHVNTKKTMDGFLGTDLEPLLRDVLGVRLIAIIGINTDTCVYSTAFSASNRGFLPVVVTDCTASTRGRDAHASALGLMSRSIAWTLSAREFIDKLRAERSEDAVT